MGSKANKTSPSGGGSGRNRFLNEAREPIFPMEELQTYAANRFPVNSPPSTSQPLLEVSPPRS